MLDPNRTTFEQFASKAAKKLGTTSSFSSSKTKVVDWEDNKNPPTDAEMNTAVQELKAEYDAQEYARNRQAAYASVGDQLDMLMKDMKNNTTSHRESCEAVKAKYPKPE